MPQNIKNIKLRTEIRREMREAFLKIFKNTDPFEEMFQDWVKEKYLLYIPGYYLSKIQFNALQKTLDSMGESSFFLSEIEGRDISKVLAPEDELSNYCTLKSSSYDEYKSHIILLDNALYSTTGKWGIIISHEDHGVVGGSDEFITYFKKFYPYLDYDLKQVLEMWNHPEKPGASWKPDVLKYVNTAIKPGAKIAPEKWQHMKQALVKVFKEPYSYNTEIFQTSIEAKLLLFPADNFYLNKNHFEALLDVLKKLEELSLFVSQINGSSIEFVIADDDDAEDDDHFELRGNISYEEYKKNIFIYENVLYSPSGTWGIFISEDNYAIIGGSHEFIELFKKFYRDWEDDIQAFVKTWEDKKECYNSDVSWIQDLLKYINVSPQVIERWKSRLLQIEHERWSRMKDAYERVFKKNTQFDEMFQDSIQEKINLCLGKPYLNEKQLEALFNAIQAFGETTIYIFQANEKNLFSFTENYNYFRRKLSIQNSYFDYRFAVPVSAASNEAYVIYSLYGTWGLIVPDTGHAILGGSHEFIELFKQFYPDWKKECSCKNEKEN